MSEGNSSEAHIRNVELEPLKLMVKFKYTPRVEFRDVDLALKLLVAAEMYNVQQLKVKCERFVARKIDSNNVKMILRMALDHDANNLLKAASDFMATKSAKELGADFTIHSKDSKSIKASKMILMAHSDVFRAMIENLTTEKDKNEADVLNVDYEPSKILVKFLHCNKIVFSLVAFALDVRVAAEKYNVQPLKHFCQRFIIHGLNDDNVLEASRLSLAHRADDLLDAPCLCVSAKGAKPSLTGERRTQINFLQANR